MEQEMNIEEIWKPVVGYEGKYEVSNLGRVRSIDRIIIKKRATGDFPFTWKGKILRPGPKESGHLTVAIGRYNSKDVHILVLEAFVGPCPEGHEGLHFDDVATNNVLSNLRWGTRSENLHDAVRNGKKAVGIKVYNAKLNDDAVRFIRLHANQKTACGMAKIFGVTSNAVQQVIDGVTWRHVT